MVAPADVGHSIYEAARSLWSKDLPLVQGNCLPYARGKQPERLCLATREEVLPAHVREQLNSANLPSSRSAILKENYRPSVLGSEFSATGRPADNQIALSNGLEATIVHVLQHDLTGKAGTRRIGRNRASTFPLLARMSTPRRSGENRYQRIGLGEDIDSQATTAASSGRTAAA